MSARDEELAREWFDRAERDLLTADTMLRIVPPPTDVVCFHCQQVAEKHLKGFLAWHGTPLMKTHDLAELLTQCCVVEPRLASLQPLALLLTDYAIDVRYPGPLTTTQATRKHRPPVMRPAKSDAPCARRSASQRDYTTDAQLPSRRRFA